MIENEETNKHIEKEKKIIYELNEKIQNNLNLHKDLKVIFFILVI